MSEFLSPVESVPSYQGLCEMAEVCLGKYNEGWKHFTARLEELELARHTPKKLVTEKTWTKLDIVHQKRGEVDTINLRITGGVLLYWIASGVALYKFDATRLKKLGLGLVGFVVTFPLSGLLGWGHKEARLEFEAAQSDAFEAMKADYEKVAEAFAQARTAPNCNFAALGTSLGLRTSLNAALRPDFTDQQSWQLARLVAPQD